MKQSTNVKSLLKTVSSQKALIAVILLFILMLFFPTNFYTAYNIIDMLNSSSILLIIAFGVTMTIVAGGCDLSVGGNMVLSGIVTIRLMNDLNLNIWLAILVAAVTGGIIGLVNGFLIVHQKTEPFIITLGMGMLLTGIAQLLSESRSVVAMDPNFNRIANGRIAFGITNLVVIMVVLFVVMHIILRYTQFGNNCYAVGGDYEVARYSGINVIFTKWTAFVICGVLAAVAGVLQASKLNSGSYLYGETTALVVNCGVVVGGVSFAGGVGSIPKAAIGIFMFGLLENVLNMLGIQSYVQTLLTGIITVAIIWFDSFTRKRQREAV